MGRHVHADLIHAWAEEQFEVEYFSKVCEEWGHVTNPRWDPGVQYRRAIVKPSIDWSQVSSEFQYLAIDGNGKAYLYKAKPSLEGDYWRRAVRECASANAFSSFKPGHCGWEDSLVMRPTGS